MKIYITGATGRLGRIVMKFVPTAIPVNLRDENLDLKKLLKHATHVIHLAGSLKFDDREELWKGNYELTKRLVEALPKKARIVYASSISVYGKRLSEMPADERTPCNPDSEYAKSKYAAEQEVVKHGNYVALRIAAIYGSGYDDYFRMMSLLEKTKMQIIGHGKNRIPFVHVEDVALAIKNALKAKTGIYVLSGEQITQEEIFRLTCKELGIPAPKHRINKEIAIALLQITKIFRKLAGKGEFLTPEHINILANDRAFNCAKAKKELKFKPRSTAAGIKEMVREYLRRKKN